MSGIYITLSLIIIFLVLKRKADFVSLACVTYLLYTYNCAIGTTWIYGGRTGYYYYADISINTYFCVLSQQILILLFLFFLKFKGEKQTQIGGNITNISILDSTFWKFLLLFCYLVFFYTIIFNIGLSSFFSYASKSELIENSSAMFSFAIWCAIILCVHYANENNWRYLIFSSFLILITFILGSRSYFVTTLISVFVVKSRYIITTFKSNLKYSILGVVLVFMLIEYKTIYTAVRALDFASVSEILGAASVDDTLSDIGEFRIVFSLYDYIVSNDYRLELTDSIVRIFSFIPFLNDFLPTTVSVRMASIAKNIFFSSSYGLGSNFWGETYSMGGYIFLLIVTWVWLLLLKKSYNIVSRGAPYLPFIIVCATYCSFYIHRLDWVQVFGCLKSVFLIFVLWKIFSKKTTLSYE